MAMLLQEAHQGRRVSDKGSASSPPASFQFRLSARVTELESQWARRVNSVCEAGFLLIAFWFNPLFHNNSAPLRLQLPCVNISNARSFWLLCTSVILSFCKGTPRDSQGHPYCELATRNGLQRVTDLCQRIFEASKLHNMTENFTSDLREIRQQSQ